MSEPKGNEVNGNAIADSGGGGDKRYGKYEPVKTIDGNKLLRENLEDLYKDMPLTKDTTCGFWIFKGTCLQRFANKKAYVVLYGIVGCIFSATYAYFNGTLSTIEKRYKIPSRNTGIISVGNDISQLFVSAAISYYAGKGHRPRWIAVGLFSIVLFCWLNALPHFLYGPGEDALSLTVEYGTNVNDNRSIELHNKKLCHPGNKTSGEECELEAQNFAPQAILFLAQFISGIGGSLYYTLGVSYMDDNIKKSKTPALISMSYFLRTLGPSLGYALASFCLKIYISPSLTPTVRKEDPRWLGAWWLGWLILGAFLLVFGSFLGLFPKQLPRAAVRKRITHERLKRGWSIEDAEREKKLDEIPASIGDMMVTFKRLLKNKVLMLNNIAAIFYFFGYMPYWIFTPKYIESQYRQSASASSLYTGTVGLVFSAIGVLVSGLVISKFKPRARYMAAWNIFVGVFTVSGIITYIFLGCPAIDKTMIVNNQPIQGGVDTCNSDCKCDFVRFSPVCGEDGLTYISPCHAGCTEQGLNANGSKIFKDCSCVAPSNYNDRQTSTDLDDELMSKYEERFKGFAVPESCPVVCHKQFVLFLIVMCLIKFAGATGRASNFLVSVRCVEERDKTVSMGFGLMFMSLFSFIPSPIFFGAILDKTCLVWGKTCLGQGNCWLYDSESLIFWMNTIAAVFVGIGTCFDAGVWYHVKNLKIFDDEIKETEMADFHREDDEAIVEKK